MSGTTVTWRGVTIHIPLAIEAADDTKTIAYERAEFARVLGWSEAEVDAERVRELEAVIAHRKAREEAENPDAVPPLEFPDLVPRSTEGGAP